MTTTTRLRASRGPTLCSSTALTSPSASTSRRTAAGLVHPRHRHITMDLNDVEHIHFNALGGADIITVNDLAAPMLTDVTVDVAATLAAIAATAR